MTPKLQEMFDQEKNATVSPKMRLLQWCFLFSLISLPVLTTLPDYGVTSDEPIYMEAAWHVKKWLSLEWNEIFTQDTINRHWKTDQGRNVHPSGLKWFYLIAQKAIFWEADPYTQNAVLNVLFFAFSLTVFIHWWSKGSIFTGTVFVLLLLLIPRFFAHIHFPATDILMTSFFMLFVVCLDRILLTSRFWIAGIILGLFISIKLTSGLLAIPVLLVFLLWHRCQLRTMALRMMIIGLIASLVFYAINPDWWFSPLSALRDFFTQSLTRRSWSPFTVYFGGRFFSYRGPFYYPFLMFFITTPLLHILLFLVGVSDFFSSPDLRKRLKMILSFTCLSFPFVLLALPISPAHDGIRYLLPAFPFVVCFMVLGLKKLWQFVSDPYHSSLVNLVAKWTTAAGAIILLAMDLHTPTRIPPFELSYYNKVVGGLSGANRIGFETTYWWEILNDDILDDLNTLCAGSSVYFPITPTDFFFYHNLKAGKILFDPVWTPESADFMLIFGRPSVQFWESRTWPIYRQEGKMPIPVWGISLDSVPLLKVYRIRAIGQNEEKEIKLSSSLQATKQRR